MGIRFYCPNGHKLNVKEHQAGKWGFCPHCGARMLIPTESTRPSSAMDNGAAQHPDQDASAATTAAIPIADEQEAVWPGADDPSAKQAPAASVPPPTGETSEPFGGDEVVWYVRPASGGQYGPAGTAVMQSWLEEGRVAADSLVWRDGWPDWRSAGDVFPQLAPGVTDTTKVALAVASPPPLAPKVEPVTVPASGATMRLGPRRKSRSRQTKIVAALVVSVVVLAFILVVVLTVF